MENSLQILETLYNNIVNEVDNHCSGVLDDSTLMLYNHIKAAIKDTYNEYCKPEDRIQ